MRDIHQLEGCNVSQVSMDSLLWQVQRLGPVLSSRYLTRNLLRMLALCYVDDNSLNPLEGNPPDGNLPDGNAPEGATSPLKESNIFQMCGASIQVMQHLFPFRDSLFFFQFFFFCGCFESSSKMLGDVLEFLLRWIEK